MTIEVVIGPTESGVSFLRVIIRFSKYRFNLDLEYYGVGSNWVILDSNGTQVTFQLSVLLYFQSLQPVPIRHTCPPQLNEPGCLLFEHAKIRISFILKIQYPKVIINLVLLLNISCFSSFC